MIRRRVPLRRSAPLGRSPTLQSRRRQQAARIARKRAVGPKLLKRPKWASWRARERRVVQQRALGRCEAPRCVSAGRHVHHAFGRVHEPWASSQLSCLHLCVEHHEKVHADATFRYALREIALRNLLRWMRTACNFEYRLMDWPEDQRLMWEALTTAAGLPPGWRE